ANARSRGASSNRSCSAWPRTNDGIALATVDTRRAASLALTGLARIRRPGLVRPYHDRRRDRPFSRQAGAVDRPGDAGAGGARTGRVLEATLPVTAAGWVPCGSAARPVVVARGPGMAPSELGKATRIAGAAGGGSGRVCRAVGPAAEFSCR